VGILLIATTQNDANDDSSHDSRHTAHAAYAKTTTYYSAMQSTVATYDEPLSSRSFETTNQELDTPNTKEQTSDNHNHATELVNHSTRTSQRTRCSYTCWKQ